MTFGYPSKQPCRVCAGHYDNQSEPRFSYTVCRMHRNVPPAFLHEAAAQYQALGYTAYDDSMMGIPSKDLEIKIYDPYEARGMRVAAMANGVEVKHIPTGTVARYHGARSQYLNREIAIDMIVSAITHPRHR